MTALYAMPGNDVFADRLARQSGQPRRVLRVHSFPDAENLVQVEPPQAHEDAALVCTLNDPDAKVLPLLMAAATLRELGAARVGLVAPYLAYMRQDARFHPGEAISARIFGKLLGGTFDWLITVDPHLHRCRSLDQVYPLDGRVVHAATRVAAWIGKNVAAPLIIGPDSESTQWVSDVAQRLGAPFVVASKLRHGDREVRVTLSGIAPCKGHTAVLVDDIISSGRTMIDALHRLDLEALPSPVCIGVHGVLARGALAELRAAGASRIITTNTIAGDTALIDISPEIASALVAIDPARAPASPARVDRDD